MRHFGWIAPALLLAATTGWASSAQAQNPSADPRLPLAPRTLETPDTTTRMSLGELTPTPQMWLYEQERRRYEDPRAAVRAKAEFKSAQRRKRIAAMQWFGYSNARPTRSATPTHNTSAPHWGSNSADPSIWSGVGRPTVVLSPETTYLR